MSIQPDLLPCPFCGSQPMILGMDRAQHPVAGCILSGRTIAAREFREWNKRIQALEAGQLCNSTVEMAECAAFSAGYEAGERDGLAKGGA